LFIDQTTLVPLVIDYDNGEVGADNKQFLLSWPKIAVQAGGPKVSEPGPIELEIPWEAYQSAAMNDEMAATLINSTSTAQ
jgi:hypothetical protein